MRPTIGIPLVSVPPHAATSLAPSAEEATELQGLLGALVCVQFAPESAEV